MINKDFFNAKLKIGNTIKTTRTRKDGVTVELIGEVKEVHLNGYTLKIQLPESYKDIELYLVGNSKFQVVNNSANGL